jgi:hypothetical protein
MERYIDQRKMVQMKDRKDGRETGLYCRLDQKSYKLGIKER